MYVTSVAATGVNFAKRISAPLRRPTPAAATNMRKNPSTHTSGERPSSTKNDAENDEEARERAHREIDSTEQQGKCLAQRDEAERRAGEHDGVDVVVRDVAAVVMEHIDADDGNHHGEHGYRRVVAFDKP